MTDLPRSETSPLRGLQFSLTSLLLSMTFVSICLAAFQFGAEAGQILLVFAVPAFVRTVVVVALAARRGKPVTMNGRFAELMFSLVLMVPIYCLGAIGLGVGAGIALLLDQLRLVEFASALLLAPILGVAATLWIWAMTLRVSQIEA